MKNTDNYKTPEMERRFYLRRVYGDKGLKHCRCGTPIISPIYIDPASGEIQHKAGSASMKVELTHVCEVCWREGGWTEETIFKVSGGDSWARTTGLDFLLT